MKHVKVILKKLLRMTFLILATSLTAFVLMRATPLDPLQTNVGQVALGSMSAEQVAKLEEYWGVGENPVKQYIAWGTDFMRGDMGTSLLYRQPVSEVIGVRLQNSLFLMATAWLLSGVLGILLGAWAGMNHGKRVDRCMKGYCLCISSTPAFWLAMLLLIVFGVWLKWFPIGFSVPIGVAEVDVSFVDRMHHFILPALTLSVTGIANIAMHTREKMIEISESEFFLFARARGEKGWGLFWNHGMRNILLPALTLQFASISEIFGGSVLVEQVFSYPGLGQAAVTAGLGSDMPLLMAITVISAMLVFGGNLIADVLYQIVDPRIRKGGER